MAVLLNKYFWYAIGIILLILVSMIIGYKLKKDNVCDNTENSSKQINQIVQETNQGAKDIADIGLKALENTIQINKDTDHKKTEVIKKTESKKKVLIESSEKDPNILGREAATTLGLEYVDDK